MEGGPSPNDRGAFEGHKNSSALQNMGAPLCSSSMMGRHARSILGLSDRAGCYHFTLHSCLDKRLTRPRLPRPPAVGRANELKSSRPAGGGAEGADRSTSGADRSTTAAAVLVFVTDTSSCGTFVNGVRIESTGQQVALSCGDRVAFTEQSAAQSCHSEHMDEALVI